MKTPRYFQRSALTKTLWSFRREFVMVGAFSMVANVLMLTPTLYMLQVYDRVMASQSELTLLSMSILTLFLFGVMAFAERMRAYLLVGTGMRLDQQLSTQVFDASFESQLSQNSKGNARAFNDLIQIRQFLTGNGVFAFFDAPWTPIYLAVLFFLHPVLGWLGIVFGLIQAALAWFGHRRTVEPSESAARAGSDATIYMQSKLRNAEVVESMGMVNGLQKRWALKHKDYMDQSTAVQVLTNRITAVSKWLRYSQQSLALGAGALLVIDGQLSPGAMIASNILMTRTLAPIDMIVGSWRQFVGMQAAFGRLEKLLVDFPSRSAQLERNAPSGAIELKQVSISVEGRKAPILDNINLAIAKGTVTAILGPSGAGKSTLARVMVGVWPGVQGQVLLDGISISDWDRLRLGPNIGYLPQDIELMDGTIAENIARFGEVEPAMVIEAARASGLHEMILKFPKGYDTPIGEAGNLLSGGQRQRVGLARAIYGNPVLVVLDEPNANLDDVGESALLKAISDLKEKGVTVFLITHRPAAVAVADRIVILQAGRILTDGPRESVIASAKAAQAKPPQPPPSSVTAAV